MLENKGPKIWTPYLLIGTQLNLSQQPQNPETAWYTAAFELRLGPQQLHPNILTQHGHST